MAYIKDRTRDFYFFTLFGVPYYIANELSEKEQIILCAHRAYGDLSRTISYLRSSTWLDKNKKTEEAKSFIESKKDFKEAVRNYLSEQISDLISGRCKESFDDWHIKCCNKIINLAIERQGLVESFTYGQAQKWINMTLKYMDISGFWDQNKMLCGLRNEIHVPVDSYILEAAADCEILLPRADGKGNSTYSKSTTKKWSNWVVDDYKAFIGIGQVGDNNLRKKTANLPKWEDENWIRIAWKNSAMNPENKE